ncbi:hypothetical protein V1477_016910, partial [Vespula maculifrons]
NFSDYNLYSTNICVAQHNMDTTIVASNIYYNLYSTNICVAQHNMGTTIIVLHV